VLKYRENDFLKWVENGWILRKEGTKLGRAGREKGKEREGGPDTESRCVAS
jgi:hypothetical protein